MSVQGLVNINDFNDAKTIDLFETVIEMFTYPCDVDFERDTSTERPPVKPQDEFGVMGFAMDPHVMRCTYAASQTQVRTHAPHTHARTHTHAHTHTHTHTHTHRHAHAHARARTHTTHAHAHARARRRSTWAFRTKTQQATTIAVSSISKSY